MGFDSSSFRFFTQLSFNGRTAPSEGVYGGSNPSD